MALCPATVLAHPMRGVGDFYAGMLHPITAIEFALPMLALSLLAGQQARKTAIGILLTFPAVLAVGAFLALLAPIPRHLGLVNIGSMAVLGVLVALGRPLPSILALGLSVVLGLTIGWANGAEITVQISPFRFVPGLALVGLLLVTYGVGFVRRLKKPWMLIGVRVVGSWIAAVGILALGLQ
jgi:urease accessory protein